MKKGGGENSEHPIPRNSNPMTGRPRTWLLCILVAVVPGLASADTLILRNGDRVTGEIADFRDGALHFKTEYAGSLTIPARNILALATDRLVTLRYTSGGYTTGILVASPEGTVRLQGSSGTQTRPIRFREISRIYPGTDVRRGLDWSGSANIGATERSGNTDNRSWHVDSTIEGRGEEDRVRLEGEFNREITEEATTQDNFLISAQHDHFATRRTYFYTNAKLEQDQLQNLALRTTVGTGAGHQVIETARTKLSVEAGPAYIHEDLETGTDRGFVAGRWAVNFEYRPWDFATLFHRHDGKVEIDNAGNTFIDSTTGVRFPLSDGFMLIARADIDWDSEPPPEATSMDKTFLLTVGYHW